jgi:hypothetical protein
VLNNLYELNDSFHNITGIENFIKNGEITTSNLKKSINNWWLENSHIYK